MAEMLHEQVRRKLWGDAAYVIFIPDEPAAEPCSGIRSAPGYPARRDHAKNKAV